MDEVELSNELLQIMIDGIQGKSAKKLNSLYSNYEDNLPHKEILMRRFKITFDNIENHCGNILNSTIYSNKGFFYILFSVIYDRMYGIKSELDNQKPNSFTNTFFNKLVEISDKIKNEEFDEQILELFDTRRNTVEKNRIEMINFITSYQ